MAMDTAYLGIGAGGAPCETSLEVIAGENALDMNLLAPLLREVVFREPHNVKVILQDMFGFFSKRAYDEGCESWGQRFFTSKQNMLLVGLYADHGILEYDESVDDHRSAEIDYMSDPERTGLCTEFMLNYFAINNEQAAKILDSDYEEVKNIPRGPSVN